MTYQLLTKSTLMLKNPCSALEVRERTSPTTRTSAKMCRNVGKNKNGRALPARPFEKFGSSPISRVLSRHEQHAVRTRAIIPLGAALPRPSSSLPGSSASHAIAPLFGLAPDGVYRAGPVTSPAVSSYLTTFSRRPKPCSRSASHPFSLACAA